MIKTYGIRHVGFFKPLLEINEEGFKHRDKHYVWDDVIAVKRDDEIPLFARFPSTTMLMSDTTIIRVPAILEEKGDHTGFSFKPFQSKSKTYNDFISLLRTKVVRTTSPFDKELASLNDIMLYRLLMGIGSVFIPLGIFMLQIHIEDKKVLIVPIGFFCAFILGLVMFIQKNKAEKKIKEILQK